MKTKQAKKAVKGFIGGLKKTGRQVDHVSKVLDGFNALIEKGALMVNDEVFFIYRELVPLDEEKRRAWIKNAYLYARLKLKYPENTTIYIKDIETGDVMGVYKDGRAVAI
ncbi:MAG: hypothetical protein WD431_11870 [Cyclobacteriaceae bacterium]